MVKSNFEFSIRLLNVSLRKIKESETSKVKNPFIILKERKMLMLKFWSECFSDLMRTDNAKNTD